MEPTVVKCRICGKLFKVIPYQDQRSLNDPTVCDDCNEKADCNTGIRKG